MNVLPLDPATGDLIRIARTDPLHFSSNGQLDPVGAEKKETFQDAMLKAMDGVNALQKKSETDIEAFMIDPESVDAHDVTISMSEANMSLSIAKTVLNRVVSAWKDLINTR